MKTLITSFFVLVSIGTKAQAHLGSTEVEIKNMYQDNKIWKSDYATNGVKFITTEMELGDFTYYFNKETQLCDYCIQVPFDIPRLNTQVERYNKAYVITSDTSWTAYLNEGGIMYIKLIYDKEYKLSIFTYSAKK